MRIGLDLTEIGVERYSPMCFRLPQLEAYKVSKSVVIFPNTSRRPRNQLCLINTINLKSFNNQIFKASILTNLKLLIMSARELGHKGDQGWPLPS